MTESRDSIPPHKFDVRFLKNLYEGLSESYEKQASALASIDKTVGKMGVMLQSFETKNVEQDTTLKEHGKRIHSVELIQASDDSKSQLRGVWHHIKRLTAFMDLQQRGTDRIDTRAIDTHAQRMQHAADIVMSHDDVTFKVALVKILPWAIITLIVAIVLTTLLTFQALTNTQVLPDIPKVEDK
jgi:hypothetical protein